MEEQFKMDYGLVFHDYEDEMWLLKATSSIRTDRLYGMEFVAQNIRLLEMDKGKIGYIFVVVPDSLSKKEDASAKNYSDKINSTTYKSFISDVIKASKLRELIIRKCMADISQGVRSNLIGKDAENRVAQLLNDKRNWNLWNDFESFKHEVKSDTFNWFKIILSGIGAEPSVGYEKSKNQIVRIDASTDIPKLKNGGYPKTDVSFTVMFLDGKVRTDNITIKTSLEKQVTVHEGPVLDLVCALQLDSDSNIAKALSAFQEYGSEAKLRECSQENYADILCSELPEYNRELVEFALFGVGNPRITNPIQVADSILFMNNPEKDCFWLRDDYVKHYISTFQEKGQFGTPFKWTYPSKKRGVSFQLKGFTNN